MDDRELENRLSHIATRWSVILQAHQETDGAALARQQLLERYCGAVYRYLLAAVHDHHAAEDLTQEFALRFVRGHFRLANPERGRFRDYVKTALFHLVDDYRSRQGRVPSPVVIEDRLLSAPVASEAEQTFTASWREELLARTWRSLAEDQAAAPSPAYVVLRSRVEQPELSSQQMGERLTALLGKPVTAAGARQLLHRARERFAELLVEETARSLGPSAADRLEDELAELNLLRYCRPVLDRRARDAE